MVVHQGFNSFSKCSSRFFSKELKFFSILHSEVQFFLFYLGFIFHLKLSLRIVAIYGAYKLPKFFTYPPSEMSFSSPCSYQSNLLFPLAEEFHLLISRCFP